MECHRHKACHDEGDAHASEGGDDVGDGEFLPYGGDEGDGEPPSHPRPEDVDQVGDEGVVACDGEETCSEDCAVDGDERKVDAEGIV